MSKVIIYSRFFPAYHPKKGKPTYFVEKLYKSLYVMKCVPPEIATDFNFAVMNDVNFMAKHTTIRAGNRFKAGDKFSPRVWSGKPYNSKQIILAPDIEIKKVYDIEIYQNNEIHINGVWMASFGSLNCELIANNDGLDMIDFQNWFCKLPFKGQIICWSDNVNYN